MSKLFQGIRIYFHSVHLGRCVMYVIRCISRVVAVVNYHDDCLKHWQPVVTVSWNVLSSDSGVVL